MRSLYGGLLYLGGLFRGLLFTEGVPAPPPTPNHPPLLWSVPPRGVTWAVESQGLEWSNQTQALLWAPDDRAIEWSQPSRGVVWEVPDGD